MDAAMYGFYEIVNILLTAKAVLNKNENKRIKCKRRFCSLLKSKQTLMFEAAQ